MTKPVFNSSQVPDAQNLEPLVWVQLMREALAVPIPPNPVSDYLDLGDEKTDQSRLQELLKHEPDLPQQDGLAIAFALMIRALSSHRLDLLRFGINEILKSYLRQILEHTAEGQETEITSLNTSDRLKALTNRYLDVIHLVFEYARSDIFPFTESLWSYLAACLQTTGLTLVRAKQWDTAQIFLTEVTAMGRSAARDGLHTTIIQYFLRRVENACSQQGARVQSEPDQPLPKSAAKPEPNPNDPCQALMQLAHNLRFNLEV